MRHLQSIKVLETEVFPNKDPDLGSQITNLAVLDVAYYPEERGPNNYTVYGLDGNGKLDNPNKNWGGMMRKLETNDFETANIEFIEFWVVVFVLLCVFCVHALLLSAHPLMCVSAHYLFFARPLIFVSAHCAHYVSGRLSGGGLEISGRLSGRLVGGLVGAALTISGQLIGAA